MSKTLLVDANSIGYAAHHATKLTSGGMETQAVFGFIKTMRELRVAYPEHKLMCLWDGRAEWRFNINPDYKSNREADPKKAAAKEAYATQRPYISRALHHLGVRQMTVATHEADDMAGLLVSQLTQKPDNEIVMISGDKDWIQLVRPNVIWRDLRDDSRIVTIDNLMDKTGYATPYGFLEGKCLQGDSSDCISGIGGVGEKGAPEFIAEFGSVRKFWQRCDSGEFKPKKKAHLRLCSAEGRMIFGRNFRMMQLLKVAPPAKSAVSIDGGEFSNEKFGELCEELAFVSILRNQENFTNAFKGR
jgi:5'-3' exonuclease